MTINNQKNISILILDIFVIELPISLKNQTSRKKFTSVHQAKIKSKFVQKLPKSQIFKKLSQKLRFQVKIIIALLMMNFYSINGQYLDQLE